MQFCHEFRKRFAEFQSGFRLFTKCIIFGFCIQIGLMRGGKFLAEESPDNLQMQYQCDTLEEVFLKLAILQNKGKRRRSSIAQEISDQITVPVAMTVSDDTFALVFRFIIYDKYFLESCT